MMKSPTSIIDYWFLRAISRNKDSFYAENKMEKFYLYIACPLFSLHTYLHTNIHIYDGVRSERVSVAPK